MAGTDPVAVDVTLALLMNVPPHRISYLGAAAARGWEGADPEKLRILGEDLQQLVMEDYEIPRELYSLSLRIPKPVVRLFRRSITPRPHVLPDCKSAGSALRLVRPGLSGSSQEKPSLGRKIASGVTVARKCARMAPSSCVPACWADCIAGKESTD